MYYVNENIRDLYRVKFHDERADVLRLDMNENPEGLPQGTFQKILQKITPEYVAMYPEKDRLTKLLAQHDQISSKNISITAGIDEALRLIFQCFGEPGKKVVTVSPTFEMYDVYTKMFGMRHMTVDYKEDFTIETEDIISEIDVQTGIVVLLNPNSPIGTSYAQEDVRRILEKAQSVGAVAVIDEAYHYFYGHTWMQMITEYDHVLVLRTFSKLFSIAGLRIGYVAGNEALINYIEKAESTFNVNTIAVLFAAEVIQDQQLLEELIERERSGRYWLSEKLRTAGYRYFSGEGNYVLLYPHRASDEIVRELKQQKIWVRDYGKGILKGWIRVSTGSIVCMEKFWNAFEIADKQI